MPVVNVDRLTNLALAERLGTVRTLQREARVTFSQEEGLALTDYKILDQALTACDCAGLRFLSPLTSTLPTPTCVPCVPDSSPPPPPSPPSPPPPSPPPPPPPSASMPNLYANLVLVGRDPRLVEQDKTIDVTLHYEHILDGPNQLLVGGNPNNPDLSGVIFGKLRTNIVEKNTNFYYPYGDPTNPRTLIVVGHSFINPMTGGIIDTGIPPIVGTFPNTYPNTVFQGGEVQVPFPQANYKVSGIVFIDDPWFYVITLLAKINSQPFLGYPIGTWLCSEVTFELLNYTPGNGSGFNPELFPMYRLDLEWQYNQDTWNPIVAFHDQRTGQPPSQLEGDTLYPNPIARGPESLQPDPDLLANFGIIVLSFVDSIVTPGFVQEAGVWQVPSLASVDFAAVFGAAFE